ncbi:unnamed protein product [Auanema sp. JU1783]|nr:unnamed protein product [Auanema sp. JU1783]
MALAWDELGQTVLPYLSVSAIVSTIGLFFCGLSICQRIRARGSTEGTGSAPFLLAFISCAFWLQYGLLKQDNVVIFVNLVGFCLQTSYLCYYYSMTRQRRWLDRIIIAELVIMLLMEYFVHHGNLKDNGLEPLGICCVFLNIANIGAPLLSVGEVIRTKSSESLPLPLCIACFCVSLQWMLYGIIVDDFVIQFPNYVATFLSATQLSLFVIYPRKPHVVGKKYSRLSDDNEEL